MKKLFYLASAAIVATMLFSCAKVENNIQSSDKGTIKVELTATTDIHDSKVTIAAKGGDKYPVTWDAEGERLMMYEVTSSGNKSYTSAEEYTLSSGNKTASFTFEVAVKEAESYDYYFFSPAAVVAGLSNEKFNVKLPASQKPGATSADPASIVLQATALAQSSQTASFNANFKMISAVGKMTLKNLPLEAGESVTSVSIQATGKDFAATANLGTDGTLSHHSASSDNISVDVSSLTTTGDFDVWFNCWPCTMEAGDKLVITANTDDAIYTREIVLTAAKEFKAGAVNEITVDMSSAEKPEIIKYNLTDLGSISATDVVVITMKIGDEYYAMSNDKGTGAAPAAALVEVKDNAISNPAENLKWNITSSEGAYVISPNGDANKVLYTTDINNGARVGTKAGASWVLDAVLDNKYLKFNTKSFDRNIGVYNNADWRTYKKENGAAHGNIKDQQVFFFAYSDSRTPQNLSFPKASYEVELGSTFTAPTVSGAQTAVTYSSSNPAVATINETTGAVTLVAAGTTIITASAAADKTYKAGSANYTLTVSSTAALQTMDEIFAAATTAGSTATSVKIRFNNWVISGVKGSNAYLTDGTKGLIIYDSSHGFEIGDKLSGTVSCKVQLYKKSAELTQLKSTAMGLTVTKGGTVSPANITIANLSGVNTGALIMFESLSYDGTDFSDGTNTIKPYGTFFTLPTFVKGYNYKVTGVYIQFDDTKEIAPRSNDDIVTLTKFLSATANKTSVAAEGETITVDVDTNVDSWTATSSDNTNFTISNKTANSFQVVVSANASTTETRTCTITVSASGVDAAQIVLTQVKKGGSSDVTETLVIGDFAKANKWENAKQYYSAATAHVTYTASGTGNNCKYYSSNKSWRFYKSGNGKITISVPDDKIIKKIEMTETLNLNVPDGWSFNSGTFTPEQGTSTNTVSITNNDTDTSQILTIAVTYGE